MAETTVSLSLAPITSHDAKDFVARHHRHNRAPLRTVFQVAVEQDGEVVGVATAERPKARKSCDGYTIEVTRTCTNGTRNANSMLYGACTRAAWALGYRRILTYTLPGETGASLRASGWTCLGPVDPGGTWAKMRGQEGREIVDLFGERRMPVGPKVKWEKARANRKGRK